MAEQQDGKPGLPIAAIFALLAMASSFLIYKEMSLQTSRPIDKETGQHFFTEKGTVPSRLWQDPFEALSATKQLEEPSQKADSFNQFDQLISIIAESEIPSGASATKRSEDPRQKADNFNQFDQPKTLPGVRVLSVFVDGSPYSSGAESRLNDRYALISALGAAGYVSESGEYMRLFNWGRKNDTTGKTNLPIPMELFIPKAETRDEQIQPYVLVLWLKDQDFSPKPLESLNELLAYLDRVLSTGLPKRELMYDVLGPRFSTGLSAMLKEIRKKLGEGLTLSPPRCSLPFYQLRSVNFYSPWATAEDIFLLDSRHSKNRGEPAKNAKEIFNDAGINFTRTIGTDTTLAEQLLQELKRRRVDLTSCADKDCNPKVALISEWDTLYGRALPRTFVAVAMNKGSGEAGRSLQIEMNKLRGDDWPSWISRHSYLAGLDGELPPKENDKGNDNERDQAQSQVKAWYEGAGPEKDAKLRPEGRSQLDYVLRLAGALKQEEAQNREEFKAIGVLGGDVYDKLLVLQALRPNFPRAIFFTTDLNARLAFPAQWESTRNLIIASHFGLELRPELQKPIPPFRDSYQTSLFYSALMALKDVRVTPHIPPDETNCLDCVQLSKDLNKKPDSRNFFRNTGPRLYEIGRHGAFDISTGPLNPQSAGYASIHRPRPDMQAYSDPQTLKWSRNLIITAVVFGLGAMLISTTIAVRIRQLGSNILFWLYLVVAGVGAFHLAVLISPIAENEPFTLTDGISAWPTAVLRLLALIASLLFLWYSWRWMAANEDSLAREFDLKEKKNKITDNPGNKPHEELQPIHFTGVFDRIKKSPCFGLHAWRPHLAAQIDAVLLWREYMALGDLRNFVMRGLPQVFIASCFTGLMLILFGFPGTPCRGFGCFVINDTLIISSVTAMMVLIFYVIDATRLCRRWVNCIAMKKARWPDDTLAKIASERGKSKENLDEWLGIELIAKRTTVIGNFIYFPFIVMALLIIGRHTYLDNWDFPVAIVIFLSLNATLVVVNGLALRRSAEKAKREAIKRLESKLTRLSDQTSGEIEQRQQIKWAINAIKSNKRGAFLPFTQHPVFGAAVALPSGGFGLVLLLEYLATGF